MFIFAVLVKLQQELTQKISQPANFRKFAKFHNSLRNFAKCKISHCNSAFLPLLLFCPPLCAISSFSYIYIYIYIYIIKKEEEKFVSHIKKFKIKNK